MKQKKDYASFSVNDFICDEFFQDWVLHQDEEKEAYWRSWIRKYPDQASVVEQARRILVHIDFEQHFPDDERMQKALEKNRQRIAEGEKARSGRKPVLMRNRYRIWRVAAALAGLILLSGAIFYYTYHHAFTTIATRYGEIRTIVLPDSSVVTLNAHSSVKYATHWKNGKARDVWLTGEAFFDVKHLNAGRESKNAGNPFIVHTKNLDVEVLGTSFDVKAYQGITKVMLKTGKVKIKFDKKFKRKDVRLTPGDLITYDAPRDSLIRSGTDAAVYTAWTDRKIILQEASVKYITGYLHEFYGYHIVMKDTTIGNRKMEGTLLLDTLPNILFVMSTALDIRIEQHGDTLIFEKNDR